MHSGEKEKFRDARTGKEGVKPPVFPDHGMRRALRGGLIRELGQAAGSRVHTQKTIAFPSTNSRRTFELQIQFRIAQPMKYSRINLTADSQTWAWKTTQCC